MRKQRDSVVDTARALGIMLVVVGHNYIVIRDMASLHDWIYSFHMPLFMMLSGVFFSPASLSFNSIQHKAQSLLKPYFAASLISAAIAAFRQPSVEGAFASFGKVLLGSVIATPATIEWVPLWFLPHLFVVQIAATLLYAATRNNIAITAIALMGVTLGQKLFDDEGLPWGLDLTAVTCGYFLLGHLIFPKLRLTLSRPNACLAWSVVLGLAWGTTVLFFTPRLDLHMRIYSGTNAFIVAAIGCAFSMGLCATIQRWQRLAAYTGQIGKYSLYILIFHGWIQGKITGTLASRLDTTWAPVFMGAAGSILVSIIIGKIIEQTKVLRLLFLPVAGKTINK